jgi:hypothetical protein
MIYHFPASEEPLDQGDIIDGCPVVAVTDFQADQLETAKVQLDLHRVLVLTQACDLANSKVDVAVTASVFDAQQLVDRQILKAADVKGPLRAGRVWGLYFLPAHADRNLAEMIVDLRRLHTVRIDLLRGLCRAGKRCARVLPVYREHLAKHFAETFCRIALPQPYETL